MDKNRKSNAKIIIRCTEEQKEALLQTKTQLRCGTWMELIEKLVKKKKIEQPRAIIQDDVYLLEILSQLRLCANNLNQMTKLCHINKTVSSSETAQLKKLAMSISTLKNKVLKTFVITRAK
jgi:hypothetical protein